MNQPHDTPPRQTASPVPATIYLRPAWRCFIKLHLWAAMGLALMLWSITGPVLLFAQALMASGSQMIAVLPANIQWMASNDGVLSTDIMTGGTRATGVTQVSNRGLL
ncbi:MAG: hypothetical protein ACOY4D_05740 [Pseudomonadota bacterium]